MARIAIFLTTAGADCTSCHTFELIVVEYYKIRNIGQFHLSTMWKLTYI